MENLLTTLDVAQTLSMSERQAQKMIDSGALATVTVGGAVYVREAELARWIRENMRDANGNITVREG